MKLLLTVSCFLAAVFAIDNGLGRKPPMGWRSWNLYGANVNQDLIMGIMTGMTSRRNMVDGKPTSLLDLGYITVGLDDNWQACGKYGPNGNTYHDASGNPVVNLGRFPDMKNMTAYAHSLGLRAGWYGNNCICSDHCSDESCYAGDVNALMAFGFDAVKLDGCGREYNLDLWASLIQQHGKAIEIENCHWGGTIPNATWCPWNFYRTSGDVRANFGSIMGNLNTVPPLAAKNLSTPGCWAYPDMLEVGCAAGPGGRSDSGLTMAETRTHFGGWAIVSSPLTLSHDVNNNTMTDYIWPVIANPEAIAVNQAYFGFSGTSFKAGDRPVAPGALTLALACNATDATQHGWAYNAAAQTITFNGQCVDASTTDQVKLVACNGDRSQQFVYNPAGDKAFHLKSDNGQCLDVWGGDGPPGGPAVQVYSCHGASNQEWTVAGGAIADGDNLCLSSRSSAPGAMSNFYKPQSWDNTKYAVLLINTDAQPADLAFTFASVPGLVAPSGSCAVRDIWQRKDLGTFSASYTASQVDTHDAAFLMLTCS